MSTLPYVLTELGDTSISRNGGMVTEPPVRLPGLEANLLQRGFTVVWVARPQCR
jgi:hypothetical protein